MNKPILSILIPSVPSRAVQMHDLFRRINSQCHDGKVEILSLVDNRTRTIGEKRQALLEASRGKYVAFCDDDDNVSDDYIATLLDMAKANVSVLCFNQLAIWNTTKSTVEFRIDYDPFGAFAPGGITKRFPWHVCAWKRSIAMKGVYTSKQWGEDADWLAQVYPHAKTQAYTDKVLHYYTHTDKDSLAR